MTFRINSVFAMLKVETLKSILYLSGCTRKSSFLVRVCCFGCVLLALETVFSAVFRVIIEETQQ